MWVKDLPETLRMFIRANYVRITDVDNIEIVFEKLKHGFGLHQSQRPRTIIMSLDHWPDKTFDLRDAQQISTLFHELHHVEQWEHFGWWQKFLRWWWNIVLPYMKRPYERKAMERAEMLLARWRDTLPPRPVKP